MELQNLVLLIATTITISCNTFTHGAAVPSAEAKHPCSLPNERYYNVTKRCYNNIDQQGPCGNNMALTAQKDTPFFADCECKSSSTGCSYRPLVHWPATSQCYLIFDQGPCQTGEWLVLDDNNTGKCEVNPCITDEQSNSRTNRNGFIFSHDGKCYTTGTTAFCDNNFKVYFVGGSSKPTCLQEDPLCFSALAIATPGDLNCAFGRVRDSTGGCEPTVEF